MKTTSLFLLLLCAAAHAQITAIKKVSDLTRDTTPNTAWLVSLHDPAGLLEPHAITAANLKAWAQAGGGTVTSVGLTMPGGLTVANSPVTGAGTLNVTLTVTGLLKGAGGSLVAALPGTDFLLPAGSGAALTGITPAQIGLGSVLNVAQEPALGNPVADGYVLTSTAAGVRSWAPGGTGTFDPASPGTIGITTPGAAYFTTINGTSFNTGSASVSGSTFQATAGAGLVFVNTARALNAIHLGPGSGGTGAKLWPGGGGFIEVVNNSESADGNFQTGRLRVVSPLVPASATDAGVNGEIAWDAHFVYVCVATNTWKRAALLSFPELVPLTPGATVATDAAAGDFFTLTATSDFTLSNPTNAAAGMKKTWRIKLAGHTMTLGSAFKPPNGTTLSLDPTDWSYITTRYNEDTGRWDIVGAEPGY